MSDGQSHEPNERNPVSGTPAREPEYLFRVPDGPDGPDGGLIYVSTGPVTDYRNYYDSFKLFIGDGTVMRDVPVTDVTRYRDGGTTVVETTEGFLFVPSRYQSDAQPSWGVEDGERQDLETLDPRDFEISESSTTVTLEGRAVRDRAPAAQEMPKPESRQQTPAIDRQEAPFAPREAETPTPAREPDAGYGY
jgi:hypothetical protein